MITPRETGKVAEIVLVDYIKKCGCHSPEDVRKVLEMLISKSALAVETYVGKPEALNVLSRTVLNLAPPRGNA